MSDTVPTVKVKADNEQGFIVINESDLTDEHELFDADKPAVSDPEKLTAAEIKEKLTAAGIAFEPNAKKAELVALLTAKPAE